MTARAFGALALGVSVVLAWTWTWPAPSEPRAAQDDAAVAAASPPEPALQARVARSAAIEAAAMRHVPGAARARWQLDRIDVSGLDEADVQHVVATGTLAAADGPATRVRLSGRYDATTGVLSRVSYRLLPATGHAAPDVLARTPGWSLQDAVQQSLAKAHPDRDLRFALDSAQASRLAGGGRRFEGFGLATMGGEARFVAFTLDLSAQGQSLAFSFGPDAETGLASVPTGE